jgi:hypothetical protein
LTININIYSIGRYPLTSANIFILFYILYSTFKLSAFSIIITLLALFYFILNAFIFSLNSNLDIYEFTYSLLLTLITIYVYLYSLFDNKLLKKINFELIIKICTVIIISIEIIQICEIIIFGTWTSWGMFEGLTVPIGTDIGRFEAPNLLGFYRPISIYVEPSYLGMVLILLLVCNDFVQKNTYIRFLIIVGIILTLSNISICALIIYIIISQILKNKKYINYLLFFMILLIIIFFDKVAEKARLYEMLIPGTSGYLRVMEPLLDVINQLSTYPFGIPPGQSEIVYSNSLFLLPLYFGIASIIILMTIFYLTYNRFLNLEKFLKYWIFIFTLLFASGGIFTAESAFLLFFINIIFNLNNNV